MGGGFADPPSMAYSPELSASADRKIQTVWYFSRSCSISSDFDGRPEYAVMGVPGADLGEFILGIHALEGAMSMPSSRRRWLTVTAPTAVGIFA